MAEDKRLKRMKEIASELFDMANEYALEKKPGVAIFLHESVNNINHAQENFGLNYKETEIPVEFIARACGLGLGTNMADLQLKDELYRKDLENESNEG
jgi:hypothetical protein